jgi:hypothetical protein
MSENTPEKQEAVVPTAKVNPLLSILRQPKIYITLPSGGKYWKPGSLNPSITGDYPVFSMTARDELLLKTPDALMNGQGIVEVLQNCVPNIIDAWECPQIDLDALLIAIRLATYGEMMTMKINHPSLEDGPADYEVNIREILERLQANTTWEDRLEVRPDLVVYLKPISYRTQTEAQMGEFETGRIVQMANDSSLTDEQKLEAFKTAFGKLTKKTIEIIGSAIYKIESTAGIVEDPEFISEFISQCDAEIFDKIKSKIGLMNDANKLKPLTITCTPEMLEKGAPPTIEVPFSFDEANFFG